MHFRSLDLVLSVQGLRPNGIANPKRNMPCAIAGLAIVTAIANPAATPRIRSRPILLIVTLLLKLMEKIHAAQSIACSVDTTLSTLMTLGYFSDMSNRSITCETWLVLHVRSLAGLGPLFH